MRIAALCLPAAEVGGDYYDLLPLGPTRMGVLVADVSGKGTSAALYMAELKGLVLSLSRIYDSPGRLLGEANRILSANMDSRSFVTMTYAVVDTAARCMRYARAGHNPMIHLRGPHGPDARPRAGRAWGSASTPASASRRSSRRSRSRSSGRLLPVLHRRAVGGHERRRRALRREPAAPHPGGEPGASAARSCAERILEEVRGFVGDALPHDDMTLVVLKVVAEEKAA